MLVKIAFPIIVLWTLVSIILHLCGVGAFAEWPIIAWPLTWPCCCILIWDLLLTILLLLITLIAVKIAG